MELLYMIQLYTLMGDMVDYEETRISRDIDIEIEVRTQMYGLGDDNDDFTV